jgi:predicted CXXCH cytochrome family protein
MNARIEKTDLRYLAALLITMASLAVPTSSLLALEESSNRECALCHIMWLTEFKREDLTPLIPYDPQPVVTFGKQDVVSTQRMCVSCHDGFVLDSRDMWKEGRHNHPVGQAPSENITIPTSKGKEIFPLNEGGRVYCGTCHSAHGTDWEKEEQSVFLRMSNVNSRICMACHFNLSTGLRDGNHPVHKVLENKPAELVSAGARFSKKDGVICQSCHRPHGGEGQPLLLLDNKQSQLCSTCHESPAQLVNSKHNLSLTAPEAKNLNDSSAQESGPCSACHIPHYARGPRLWARSVVPAPDFLSSTCISCHDEQGLASKEVVGKHSHPVGVPISNIGIQVKDGHWSLDASASRPNSADIKALPLFSKNGALLKDGGQVTCLTCHNPHQWKPEGNQVLESEQHLQEGDGSSSFLRIANDGDSQLCTNCHVDQSIVRNSKHNLGHTAPEESNSEGMNVSQSGSCSACHLPHNGAGVGMWARALSDGFTGIEQTCVSCHKEGGAASEYLTGDYSHPLHRELNNHGDEIELPLFDAQGGKKKDGVVDCGTCHDPHRWDPEAVEASFEETEGDASNSFLRIKASEKSALCQECHRNQNTVEGTDHDLSISAPEFVNGNKQTVLETGLCGQCHTVHNANHPGRLSLTKPVEGEPTLEHLCTGCHNWQGVAYNKVPQELRHPRRQVPQNSSRLRNGMASWNDHPVFNEEGANVGLGEITCVTCHNPHQWDPNDKASGSGVNQEGDVMNSFLRRSATDFFLCADCHGRDSIYRYKFFHWPKSRELERPRKPE